MNVERYNRGLSHAESRGDVYARGPTGEGMRAAARGKYQLTASTAEDLVEKYGDEYPELRGESGEAILDIVEGNEALQDKLQATLYKDQRKTIQNMKGDPDDPQAHAMLHRFGSGVTRDYIEGTLDPDQAPGIDKQFDQTPREYMKAFREEGGLPDRGPQAQQAMYDQLGGGQVRAQAQDPGGYIDAFRNEGGLPGVTAHAKRVVVDPMLDGPKQALGALRSLLNRTKGGAEDQSRRLDALEQPQQGVAPYNPFQGQQPTLTNNMMPDGPQQMSPQGGGMDPAIAAQMMPPPLPGQGMPAPGMTPNPNGLAPLGGPAEAEGEYGRNPFLTRMANALTPGQTFGTGDRKNERAIRADARADKYEAAGKTKKAARKRKKARRLRNNENVGPMRWLFNAGGGDEED